MKINKENIFSIIGAALGLVLGYLYYFFIGCENGCPIKSNSWLMTIYGGLIGYLSISLIFSIINPKK